MSIETRVCGGIISMGYQTGGVQGSLGTYIANGLTYDFERKALVGCRATGVTIALVVVAIHG